MSVDFEAVATVQESNTRKQIIEALHEEAAYPTKLARELDIDQPSASRTLIDLREVGLVELAVDEDRPNYRYYELTEKGQEVAEYLQNATTDGGQSASPNYPEYGEPFIPGLASKPTFDTTQVVDWRCPDCLEDGFAPARIADYEALCTNAECPVRLFSVFRGEPDTEDNREPRTDGGQPSEELHGTTEQESTDSTAEGQQPTDALTEELPDDVLDRMQSYQQDSETIEETLERVVNAFVPHAVDIQQADLNPGSVDGDTRLIHQRWPDRDDYMGSYLYTTPGEFVRAYNATWEVSD